MTLFSLPYVRGPRVMKEFFKPSMTKQSFKQDCDINNIMARYRKVLGVDFLNQYQGYLEGKFGDVSLGLDYRTALEKINEGKAVFEAMPSDLRARFGNDPGFLLDFLADPANRDEAVKLGFLNKPEVKQANVGENLELK